MFLAQDGSGIGKMRLASGSHMTLLVMDMLSTLQAVSVLKETM